LDVSGTISLNGISKSIELVSTTPVWSASITLDYNLTTQNAIYYLGQPTANAGVFTIQLNNFPFLANVNRAYTFSIVYQANGTSTTQYCNTVQVSSSTSGYTTYVVKINGGTVPAIATTNYVMQTFTLYYTTSPSTASLCFTSITVFS